METKRSCLAVVALLTATLFCSEGLFGPPDAAFSDDLTRGEFAKGTQRIEFRGNLTFSDEELSDALLGQADQLLAMHPMADPADLRESTKRLLMAGYRKMGFGDVSVLVYPGEEPSSVLCEIEEGQRYTRGDVIVDGCKKIDAQLLHNRLTRRHPETGCTPTVWNDGKRSKIIWIDEAGTPKKLSKPIWVAGDPAPFDCEQDLGRRVNAAMASLGYSQAFVLVRLESHATTRRVNLRVSVASEGEPDQIDSIVVDGLERNTEAGLVSLLKLEVGQPCSEMRLQQIRSQLWESGRFESINVSWDNPAKSVNIELKELPHVPLLGQPLSKAALVVQSMRAWLIRSNVRGEDTEAWVRDPESGTTLHAIQSSDGLYIQQRMGSSSEANDSEASDPVLVTILVDADRLLINHSQIATRFQLDLNSVKGKVSFTTTLRGAKELGKPTTLFFTGNISSERDTDELPCSHHWRMSPADALSLAYHPSLEMELTDSQLRINSKGKSMVVEKNTGEISQWQSENTTVRFGPGLFADLQEESIHRIEDKPNAFDRTRGLTTLISYLMSPEMFGALEETFRKLDQEAKPTDPVALSAARKMVGDGLLCIPDAILLRLAESEASDGDDQFSIPTQNPASGDWKQKLIEIAAQGILNAAPDLLAEGEWPMKLTREACLTAIRRNKYSEQVLQDLLSDPTTGPLCHAAVTYLLNFIGQDTKKVFATRGLLAMSPELFANDYEVLTKVFDHDLFIRTVRSVQTLNHFEMQAVLDAIDNESLAGVLEFAALHPLEAEEDRSHFWYEITRARLETWLQSMSRE